MVFRSLPVLIGTAGPVMAVSAMAVSVMAGPLVCTTTLEASDPAVGAGAPVEVTRCEPVETTSELINRRFYSWTTPFARGVDPVHQLSELLGIAWGGVDGDRLMGFGFPDQTIVWDASALRNTSESLLEEQSPAMPWRTIDLPNGFNSSLAIEAGATEAGVMDAGVMDAGGFDAPIQPLW